MRSWRGHFVEFTALLDRLGALPVHFGALLGPFGGQKRAPKSKSPQQGPAFRTQEGSGRFAGTIFDGLGTILGWVLRYLGWFLAVFRMIFDSIGVLRYIPKPSDPPSQKNQFESVFISIYLRLNDPQTKSVWGCCQVNTFCFLIAKSMTLYYSVALMSASDMCTSKDLGGSFQSWTHP